MSARRFTAVLLVIFLFALIKATPAETSIYGTATGTDFGLTGSNYGNGAIKPDTGGFTAGAFYTFRSRSRLKAGIDARITYSPGYNGGHAYTGAFRVSWVPNQNRLRPYFQIGGGEASTEGPVVVCSGSFCGTTTSRVTTGVLQLAAGLDIRTTAHLDIRALELGADAGSSIGPAHAGTGFLSAGVVYHF